MAKKHWTQTEEGKKKMSDSMKNRWASDEYARKRIPKGLIAPEKVQQNGSIIDELHLLKMKAESRLKEIDEEIKRLGDERESITVAFHPDHYKPTA
jgi:hypothetical protein